MGLTRGRDEGEEAAAVRWCSRNENRQSLQSLSLSHSPASVYRVCPPYRRPPHLLPAGKEGGGGCRGGGLEASFPCVRTYTVVAAPLAYYTKLYTGLATGSLRGEEWGREDRRREKGSFDLFSPIPPPFFLSSKAALPPVTAAVWLGKGGGEETISSRLSKVEAKGEEEGPFFISG